MKSIMYHYVREPSEELPYFKFLNVDDFKQQLDFFEKEEGFVSRDDFIRAFETGETYNGVVLTFDDGFKDHFEYVLPILRERGLWGVFYIPTGPFVNKSILNVHRIHLLLGTYGGKRIFDALTGKLEDDMLTHKDIKEFTTNTYDKQDNDAYTKMVKRILNYYIGYEFQGPVVIELMKEFLNEDELIKDFYVSQEEIKKMHDEGMIVGSHTVNHPVMSKLSDDEQRNEVADSFGFLDGATGGLQIRTFCYPYGGFHSFNEQSEKILIQNGCKFAFNVESRSIEPADLLDRPTALPRYDCNEFPHGQCR
ncbi:MAG: polysaccharide deacetylase family protein [Ignavibacteriae bacterium]|nr:polysaccharide deacetylase family protein [Ignavibacteriota bacterium]MCB9244475.1 polysaccharide deacetylase family protein [Ignavibacteriales bacterium]